MIQITFSQVLEFLNTFLVSGYGLLFLGVFALDCRIILTPLSNLVNKVVDSIKGKEKGLPVSTRKKSVFF